jgi:hypothetical protein
MITAKSQKNIDKNKLYKNNNQTKESSMNLRTITALSLVTLCFTLSLNAMDETGTSTASQRSPRTIFNLNIEASLVNKQNQLLTKRSLNCTAYANDTITEHHNRSVPFVSDVSSATEEEIATQYSTEIKMLPVFESRDLKTNFVKLQCAITKTLNGNTTTLQSNQHIRFTVVGIRETQHTERIDCDEELILNITAKPTLSKKQQAALNLGIGIDFFD